MSAGLFSQLLEDLEPEPAGNRTDRFVGRHRAPRARRPDQVSPDRRSQSPEDETMAVPLTALIILLFLVVALAHPWVMMFILMATPAFKLGLIYYVPLFQKVDFTALVCAMALLVGLWSYFRRAHLGRPLMLPWAMLFCMLGLALLLAVGLLHSTAPAYGRSKTVQFAGIGIPFLVLPSFYVRCKEDGHAMIRMVILAGIVVSVFLIGMQELEIGRRIQSGGPGRANVLGGSPGNAALVVGMAILITLTFFYIKGSTSRLVRQAALIVLPIGVLAILMSGSRSCLLYLFLVATVLPILSAKRQHTLNILIRALLLPLALIIIFSLLSATGWEILERWTNFFEQRGTATQSRTLLYSFVLRNWWTHPVLGHGAGSFLEDYSVGVIKCPHNIILEALYEEGIVGMLILLLFLFFVARTAVRGFRQIPEDHPRDRLLIIAPLIMVVFMVLRSMTSVDLDEIRFLYLASGLLHANVAQLTYSNHELTPALQLQPLPLRGARFDHERHHAL